MKKLLFFRSDSCAVCHQKAPVARRIAEEMKLELEIVDIGAPDGHQRASGLRVSTIPALVLVDGERVPFRLMGRMITPENVAHLAAATDRNGR